MAVSAFKSTSRRGNSATSSAPHTATAVNATRPIPSTKKVDSGEPSRKPKVPPRRSRSVSAFSRARPDLDLDFTNKRDNPLFWDADSPPSDGHSAAKTTKSDQVGSRGKSIGCTSSSNGFSASGGERRGRTASRDSGSGEGKSAPVLAAGRRGVGRSLSRVDTERRRRSVSRSHYRSSSEERECTLLKEKRKPIVNGIERDPEDKPLITRSNSDLAELLDCWGTSTWSPQHPPDTDDSAISQCSLFTPHWEGGSISSFSDAEERVYRRCTELTNLRRFSGDSAGRGVIRAGESGGNGPDSDIQDNYENVVRRSNSACMPRISVGSPPESVYSVETDPIIGIGEYARKLEESEERARKLRAELAIEEHRGEELCNILKEIIPYEETPDVKKPRAVRKASTERRKVSRCLEEEAMAFFDECVSISTFDDSELSSFEDPIVPMNTAAATAISEAPDNLGNSGSRVSGTPVANNSSFQSLEPSRCCLAVSPNVVACPSTAKSISSKPHLVTNSKGEFKRRFSFSNDGKKGGSELEHEIKLYVKAFAKGGSSSSSGGGGGKGLIGRALDRRYKEDEYGSVVPSEKMLLERMSLRNRIESGGLIVCGCREEFGFPFVL